MCRTAKVFLVVSALAAAMIAATPTRAQSNMAGGAEKAVAALENQWLQGQKTSNPALVAPLLADKFINTDESGKVTGKAETLADVKNSKWTTGEYDDVKVMVYGSTAIAPGGGKDSGTDASGKPLNINDRWTDTWVKMANGKWECVASHQSAIKM